MTSTGFLSIIIGIFVILNAANIVGVIQGNKTFGAVKPASSAVTTTGANIATGAAAGVASGIAGGK